MATNTRENGFESLIVNWLVNQNHYEQGLNSEYNQDYAIDETRLFRFLIDTQKNYMDELRILESDTEKKKFLDRLSKKLSDSGVVEVLRKGFKYKHRTLEMYMVKPSEGNHEAQALYIPVRTDIGIPVPDLDTLTNIIATFHDIWGNCNWTDEDKIKRQIADLPDIVKQDEAYQNAIRYSDAQNARDESDRATFEAILRTMASGMELYTAFQDDKRNSNNQSFKKWLLDMVFNATYTPGEKSQQQDV